MSGGGGQAPPPPAANGGEFLLSLLQRPAQHQSQTPTQPITQPPHQQSLALDPAVAVVGPSLSFPPPWSSNGPDLLYHSLLPPWSQSLSPSVTPNFLGFQHPQNPFPPSRNQFSGSQFAGNHLPNNQILGNHGMRVLEDDLRKLRFAGNDNDENDASQYNLQHKQPDNKLIFGSFSPSEVQNPQVVLNGSSSLEYAKREVDFPSRSLNGLNRNQQLDHQVGSNSSNSDSSSSVKLNSNAYSTTFPHEKFESREQEGRGGGWGKHEHMGTHRSASISDSRRPPPGFPSKPRGGGNRDIGNRSRGLARSVDREDVGYGEFRSEEEKVKALVGEDGKVSSNGLYRLKLSGQLDCPGPPAGSNLHSVSASNIEETLPNLHYEAVEVGNGDLHKGKGRAMKEGYSVDRIVSHELDDIGEELVGSLLLEDESHEKNSQSKHHHREKDSRLDTRGHQLLNQRMRFFKRQMQRRGDIERLNAPFLAIYESLIPPDEEKAKQKQLLTLLEKLVISEWPRARLYLYGSCANSFGVSKSDIDVCLALEDADVNKSEVLLKLADILQADNLQNVQALTRARVPIVKLMDPVTGISCDICINNVLAVINTKLLRDYAQIDVRLRQLAFIVKHWAKLRGVNETYQGTLSSYAYVLMCIHFLQQRRPAILPCLQGMKITYSVTVDDIKCAYFDQVDKLRDFGSDNQETISQLVWAFFNYWAYSHDYANAVISVRTGRFISKQGKDWTRRIGNDRHLICIEDPFEVSHDLGRVVDKYSIKVLREEFERAAEILQYDPNPCAKLFEPYIPS